MPLINGQKMACEPCIRGHRSTKCTHANERLMVPVRKPGRPLSTCPHPPSRGCGCGSVTAAIPRKQKCNCGPSTPADSDVIKVESPVSEAVPTSPARSSTVSSASYRVQKQSSKPNSRKQSFGPATLDRIDSSQFNIIPTFDAAQTIPPHLNGGMDAMGMPTPRPSMEYGQMPMMGPDGILQSHMVFPMYQTPMPPIMLPPDVQKQSGGVTMAAPKPPTASSAIDSPKNGGGGSCCSGGAKSAKTTPPASTESSPKVAPKPTTGSCCSSKNKSPPPTKNGTLNGTPLPPINGVAMPPFQPPPALASQVFQQYYPQPTLFHYPASYGSYMTPLQPAQWRQTMQALQYRQALPANGSYDMSTPMVYGQNASPDYVRSAWQSMVEDSYHHSNGHGLHVANGNDGASGANGTNGHADGVNGASDLPPSRDGEHTKAPRRGALSSRSRSPRASDNDRRSHHHRRRSPDASTSRRHETQHHHHKHRSSRRERPARQQLPFEARPLHKSDLAAFRPLFAYYLDLQKGRDIQAMDEREARGRWKSFVGKWNDGALSEGWYDPDMFASAVERAREIGLDDERDDDNYGAEEQRRVAAARTTASEDGEAEARDRGTDSGDDEDMGPALPPSARAGAATGARAGPGMPSLDDVAASREQRAEDAARARREAAEDLRHERKADRREQREKLDELVPRAEAGTRERRLEKKSMVNEKMKGFREGSPGAAVVGDRELMGGGDGVEELRREREREERKKTERELRREEIARAKAAEREERVREWKEREEGTMKALKELAKARFG
ncbi:hypothetical protein D7B24_004788 [Verticillium nonalfalfae]|uniref:Copper-fist domain-containing protein n=1 Tax=Verticillium nonalfalfae TaxID=1051616 RepID=A0A3M9YEY3_9PEZI|nr:uncharacterized protein D7B24_004788 [Verticillium nonalfalfae]RNJ58336.1 hypothetical protein D7B24_004788 [Verticillium nonalfalfae]